MSSEPDPDPAARITAEQQNKSVAEHLADLLISLRWPIFAAVMLLIAGVAFAVVRTDLIPVTFFRIVSILCLVSFVTLVWLGPAVFLGYLWVTMRSATPIVIGDRDHKQMHCKLVKNLDRYRFTDGLPRQRATDLGAGYVVLEAEDEPEDPEVDAVYNTPLTEKQPSWFDLVETEQYQEWRKVRVDLTEVVRESVEEKQRLYAQHIEKLREQCNRLIVGVQSDLELSDVEELNDTKWSADLEPEGPDQTDDVMDEETAALVLDPEARGGVADD